MYNFLVDSHCHLNMLEDEKGLQMTDVVKRANENGVNIINNICTDVNEFDKILNASKKFKNVFTTVGVHPSNTENKIPTLELLLEYTKDNNIVGIGESGLEYFYEPIDKIKQKKNFEIHIEAARKSKLPLVIHSRNADEDMIEILNSEMKNGEFKFILHCFSSGKKLCWSGLDLDGYISLSGIVTFKNAQDLRDIVKDVPLNKILLETDSPYLAPTPFRGKVNEPCYVKEIANYLVDFLKIDFNIIQQNTTKNFLELFSKVNYRS